MATRAMSEAQYFSTGAYQHDQYSHYGLAASHYTHFTSPIRRYADIIVHRQLLLTTSNLRSPESNSVSDTFIKAVETPLFTNKALSQVAGHINGKNRSAKFASMQSQDIFLARFLLERKYQRAEAVICGMRKDGLVIVVPR